MDFHPLITSIKVAFISTFFVIIFGILIAYFTTKTKRFSGLIDAIFTLPIVLPPTVIGFLLLMFFGTNSFIGHILDYFGIHLPFTITGAILASFVVSLPFMYKTTKSTFDQINPDVVNCAKTLGISEFNFFTKILIPQSMPGIITGAILSFARGIGEFGATIMFAGNIPNKTQTISTKIYTAVQTGNLKEAFFWVAIVSTISFTCLVFLNIFVKKQKVNGGI